MILDITSVLAMTALVVSVSGALFIVETLLRRDEGAGRVWAIGFLAAMLTAFGYIVWYQVPGAWWAIAIGNGAFVAGTGFMWLGCRRFNGRRMAWPSGVVAAGSVAALLAVVFAGPDGGDWAGAVWMFAGIIVFAGAGAVECLRGTLLESRTAWLLAAVLGVQSLYYVSRTTAFLTSGPESTLFQTAFGTVTTSMLTVALTVVAVVVTSVLRASRAPIRGFTAPSMSSSPGDDVLAQDEFRRAIAELCARAERRSELVGVISVRIEDLEQISSAFGSEVVGAITETWRTGVRRHAPSNASVGEDGPSGLLVGVLVDSERDARRQAAVMYRGLFEDMGDLVGGVIPVVGVGVALSDVSGYEPSELLEVARQAASRAATSVEASVLVGEAD